YLLVEFENTLFYPGGGGQPCDMGKIEAKGFSGVVIDVFREGDKIIHKVKADKGDLSENQEVILKIDEERRIRLVRMHTGEHILFKCLEKTLGEVTLKKIDLEEKESSLFINTKEISWEKLFKTEELVNRIIEENREIIEKEYPKEDAVALENLRIKPERIKSETVRIIEIKDFDWSACTGTHAAFTGFVGNLLITKSSFVKGAWEIKFKVNVKDDFFELSRAAREAASLLGTEVAGISESIERIMKETEEYKKRFRELSYQFLDNYKTERIKDKIIIYNIVEDIEKKQLIDKSTALLKEKTIVCFISKANGKSTVLVNASEDINRDIPTVLNKVLSKFNGKGGGRGSFAMGSVEDKYSEKIIEELKSILI
ncbi:hypothetical protein JXC34_02810, partial [Candidatus Woesearchaeota archaeon]|nr:hypothetical protein [Candidatus Woesearchaeota archaeon]